MPFIKHYKGGRYVPVIALANDIKEHAAKNLPRFKRPQRIHFMDALPRTATGKVQRFKLRQMSTR